MRIQRILLAILLACWNLPIPAMAQHTAASQKPPPPSDFPVTATITDYIDVTGLPRFWMQIRSDGATYTNTNSVQSIIQGASGDWILDSQSSTAARLSGFQQAHSGHWSRRGCAFVSVYLSIGPGPPYLEVSSLQQ
jgi:hypothetical protein